MDIPVHQAKFHLDKLEAEGLLVSDYARLHGRTGPGAGRPSKLYRRAERDIAVSLPDREYQLAGQLMADAIAAAAATGTPVTDTLYANAHARGRSWGESAIDGREPPATVAEALELATEVMAEHGYEPRHDEARVVLANCPFHQLAQTQTELVCQMNHALLGGLTEALQPHCPAAELDPGPDRCCVVLREPT